MSVIAAPLLLAVEAGGFAEMPRSNPLAWPFLAGVDASTLGAPFPMILSNGIAHRNVP